MVYLKDFGRRRRKKRAKMLVSAQNTLESHLMCSAAEEARNIGTDPISLHNNKKPDLRDRALIFWLPIRNPVHNHSPHHMERLTL